VVTHRHRTEETAMSLYRFTITNGQATTLLEQRDDGSWEADPLEAGDSSFYDAVSGTVVWTELRDGTKEVTSFKLVAGSDTLFYEVQSWTTDLAGNPTSDPVVNDDIDDDGFDDDDVSGDDRDDDISGHGGDDRLAGNGGDDSLSGDDGNDTLSGGSGDDSLAGGAGADRVSGGDGNDRVLAGDDHGNDVYAGGTGADVVDYTGADAGVTVNLGTGTASGRAAGDLAHIGSDTFAGFERARGGAYDDRIAGSAGANTLAGGAGNDTVTGGAGSDVLIGGTGADKLYGGTDSVRDVFDFDRVSDSRGAGSDDVYQFRSGTDDFDLRSIDANSALAGNQAFAWGGTKAVAHGVWVADTGADIRVFADVNGDKVADFSFDVMGVSTVVASDFML
jgi:Ca2+-binding RTX toxin-like protein